MNENSRLFFLASVAILVIGGFLYGNYRYDIIVQKRNEAALEAFESWSEEGVRGNVTKMFASADENISDCWDCPDVYVYNRVVLRLTLCNGTHLIQSVLYYNEYTDEVKEIENFLFYIDEGSFELVDIYDKLIEIPNYESFFQVLEGSP